MTEKKQTSDNLSSQQRAATLITLITFILMLIVSVVTLFFIPNEDKTLIDNFMMPGIALGAGYGYFLARRGDHIRGIYVLLGIIAAGSALYPLAANNVGWQTAIVMLLITTSIANGTLPNQAASRVSAAAFVFALVIILIEIFVPGVTNIPTSTSSIIVTGILIAVYLGVIFFRFPQYALQTKLIIAFIALSILSVGAVAITINRLISNELTARIADQLTGVANSVAINISDELTNQANLLQVVARDANLKKVLTEAPVNSDLDKIQLLDEEWRNAVAANNTNSFIFRRVLDNEVSVSL